MKDLKMSKNNARRTVLATMRYFSSRLFFFFNYYKVLLFYYLNREVHKKTKGAPQMTLW